MSANAQTLSERSSTLSARRLAATTILLAPLGAGSATETEASPVHSFTAPGTAIFGVPATGTYNMLAVGAGGGASVESTFAFTAGEVLTITVGSRGRDDLYGAGGGGGSFVVITSGQQDYPGNTPLLICGGGGGSVARLYLPDGLDSQNGGDATGLRGGDGLGGRAADHSARSTPMEITAVPAAVGAGCGPMVRKARVASKTK